MGKSLRWLGIALSMFILITGGVFAGGGQEESSATPSTGTSSAPATEIRELIIGISQEPANLNPVLIPGLYGEAVAGNIFDTLVSFKEDSSRPAPLIARRWDISPDGLSYTFYLRDDVVFHDGTPLTAEDVEFTIEAILDPANASPSKEFFNPVEEIVVEDDYTITFNLSAPYAPFLLALGNPTCGILPKAIVEEVGMDEFDLNPVGTGPYRFVEWRPDDRIVLEKNPDYFITEPALDRVIFRPIPKPETMAAEVLAGGIDIAGDVLPQDIPRLRNDPAVEIMQRPGLSNSYLGFNAQRAPFNDVRFREALFRAVPFDQAIQGIWSDAAQRAYSWIPPGVVGNDAEYLSSHIPGYDPERAAQLFAELRADGVIGDNFSFTLYTNQDPYRTRMATTIATELRDYGVDVQVETPEWGTLFPILQDGPGVWILGWGSVPDPDRWTYKIFVTDSSMNFSQYSDPAVDQALELGRTLVDPAQRQEQYEFLMRRLLTEELVHIPFVWMNVTNAVSTRVVGYEPSPQTYFHLVTEERNVTVE